MWDEDDDAGLESVSEPELDDPVAECNGSAEERDDLDVRSITIEAVATPTKPSSKARLADEEDEWEMKLEAGSTPSSHPVLIERHSNELRSDWPAAVIRMRTESWVETSREGNEAPNGGSAL